MPCGLGESHTNLGAINIKEIFILDNDVEYIETSNYITPCKINQGEKKKQFEKKIIQNI